jgi:hypothetical protein
MTDQLSEQKESPLSVFVNLIRGLTKQSNQGDFDEGTPLLNLERFSLEGLIGCFSNVKNKEKFLTDLPYQSYMHELRQTLTSEETSPRELIREGVRMTCVVTPCDLNGLVFPEKYLDDTKNDIYPYFRVYYSNPDDPRGMVLGYENLKPAPYLAAYPEEIVEECSFVVKYDQPMHEEDEDKTLSRDEKDLNYLARETERIYRQLQKRIKSLM